MVSASVEAKSRRVADHARSVAENGLDKALLNKALQALLKYHEKTSSGEGKEQLLGTDKLVQVQIGLAKVPEKTSPKPIRVEIPHPLHKVVHTGKSPENFDDDYDSNLEEAEVCIIVKEESKPWVKALIENFPNELGCVKKVLGLQSLRNKHSRYQQRRELLDRYDVFLCDDRILPMVGKAIGKNFFEAKKQPVPIKLTRKEALPFAVQKCLRATYMYISAGTCINVRAGNTGMPTKHLNENIQAIVSRAVDKIPRKWANVRSIAIKLPDSTSLPVYNRTPEELEEIAWLAGTKKASAAVEEEALAQKSKDAASEEKKRKKELAAKSPLVRALKKQKVSRQEEEMVTTSSEDVKRDGVSAQKKKKKKAMKNTSTTSKSAKEGDVEDAVSEKKSEKKKKQKRKQSDEGEDPSDKVKKTKAKEDFIPSKKFIGSKKGYAFYKGKKGIGYYVDKPPVVDKMALAALARLAKTPMSSGRRTSKSGKGKGRRGCR